MMGKKDNQMQLMIIDIESLVDMHIFDSGIYLAPVITWGKYEQKENKLIMPLTLQIHHAAADGFHVARFFSDIQIEMEKLSNYLMAR